VPEGVPQSRQLPGKDRTALLTQLLSGGLDAAALGGARRCRRGRYVAKEPGRIAVQLESLQADTLTPRWGCLSGAPPPSALTPRPGVPGIATCTKVSTVAPS
jgi:hypothetical protein